LKITLHPFDDLSRAAELQFLNKSSQEICHKFKAVMTLDRKRTTSKMKTFSPISNSKLKYRHLSKRRLMHQPML